MEIGIIGAGGIGQAFAGQVAWGMLIDKFGTPWIVNGERVRSKLCT